MLHRRHGKVWSFKVHFNIALEMLQLYLEFFFSSYWCCLFGYGQIKHQNITVIKTRQYFSRSTRDRKHKRVGKEKYCRYKNMFISYSTFVQEHIPMFDTGNGLITARNEILFFIYLNY